MVAGSILLFLVGAVLAWGFRVWILVPFTLLAMVSSASIELWSGASLATAFGIGVLGGVTPQFGYAFGLFARQTLAAVRGPLTLQHGRRSVATLYRRHDPS